MSFFKIKRAVYENIKLKKSLIKNYKNIEKIKNEFNRRK
jgi:hypothetical protein